jgi:hypothetical protein
MAVHIGPGPEILRRMLLGLITALMVARPLVLGEDPGLTDRLSDASNLVLTLLWLIAAVVWAAWRAWSRQGTWYGSLVEAGLLVVVILVSASAATAAYKHPAYLIACEWLVLLVAFCLVRQVASSSATGRPGDNHRMLAALLASGVSLSAYAIYQYGVEMPPLRETVQEHPELFSPAMAKRILETNVYATFAHPNAFAGYLALLLPGLVGAAWVCRRRAGWSWQTVLIAGCSLLTAIGLWLTHSRGAILGCLLIGAAMGGCWLLRTRNGELGARSATSAERGEQSGELGAPRSALRAPSSNRSPWLLGLLAPCVLLLVIWLGYGSEGFDLARQSLGKRLDYWSATWKMITDGKHPKQFWLGVGPGNFSRHYTQYMSPTAYEQVKDPHDFLLEIWATSGVAAMVALLATLGLFFWATRGAWSMTQVSSEQEIPESEIQFATRWEFYLGGMAGMILGFVLSSLTPSPIALSSDQVLINGVVAGCRATIWFATFALLETVPWTAFSRKLVLTAGVAALLLNLTVSGGIAFPSVAQPLWIMAALALNTLPLCPISWPGRGWLGLLLPLPILAAACLLYELVIFSPVSRCMSYLSEAGHFYPGWLKLDQEWQAKMTEGSEAKDRQAVIARNKAYLDSNILPALRKAVQADGGNVHALTERASWYGERWKLDPRIEFRRAADIDAHLATTIDPEGLEGYLTKYQLNLLFARFSESARVSEFYDKAIQAMAEVVKRDRTNVHFRFQYLEVLIKNDKTAEARLQIDQCLALDRQATDPGRKLADPQREQIQKWLSALTHD